MLEPSFEGLESSAATGHGNISDLHNSVHTRRGMTVERHNQTNQYIGKVNMSKKDNVISCKCARLAIH